MIKVETLGMIEIAKINPVLKSEKDVHNYDFITVNDILYLIANTIVGDDAYLKDVVIKAGDYLNGYQVDAWVGQKLVVDEAHIAYADDKTYADLNVDDVLTVNDEGKLAVGSAPESGIYFKVTDKVTLTEKAVKVLVCAA